MTEGNEVFPGELRTLSYCCSIKITALVTVSMGTLNDNNGNTIEMGL